MLDRRFARLLVCGVLVPALIALGSPAQAGTISLAWDAVSHPQLAGYRVYYGTTSRNYTANVSAGATTASTLSGLTDCTNYFMAVKSYAADGTLSEAYSNEISGWPRPVLLSASPQQLQRGAQVSLTIGGTNFRAGASVDFDDPAITVTGVTINSCQQLVANVTVGASAVLGASALSVINSDQVFGAAGALVSVIADGSAPVLSEVAAGAVGGTNATISWRTSESANGQVFFRRTGETSYQSTAVDAQMTTDHDQALTGLSPQTAYEYYVRSADGAGNAATSSPQTFTTLASSFSYLRIEAEDGAIGAPIQTTPGTTAFNGEWIQVPAATPNGTANNPAGTAQYGFHVPNDATWNVWLRMYGTATTSDSWYEKVDNATYQLVKPAQVGTWQWVAARPYTLTAGLHTLRLGGHEAQARVDRILITDDPNFVPTEQPGADVTPPTSVTSLQVTPGNGMNQLSWTDPATGGAAVLVIRYRTDGVFPTSPVDGFPLVQATVVPGSAGSYLHSGLSNGTTYSYAVFTLDLAGNVSAPATAQSAPAIDAPDPVTNVRRTDTH